MKIYHNIAPQDFCRYDTEEIREHFLMEELFVANQITANYTHIDRMITLGIVPRSKDLQLKDFIDIKQLGTSSFLERREIGIINLGKKGKITADGQEYLLEKEDALYVGKNGGELSFSSVDSNNPAKFYAISSPAHHRYPVQLITKSDAKEIPLGSIETSNERVIRQYLHPDILTTCQLCMGITTLGKGSVWNTMPAHTHERRMEIYCYFDLPEDQIVFHYMGEPQQTRHIVVQNEQAVLSPSWSIHAGSGTSNYKFIWAMAGENQTFEDMDFVENTKLR